jgi:hypothetical protein
VQHSLRKEPPVAFSVVAATSSLDRVLRRAAFLQDVVGLFARPVTPHLAWSCSHQGNLVFGVPVNTLAEYASQYLPASKKDSMQRLDALLAFLLHGHESRYAAEIRTALASKKTTLALTHDLHIYKAKFFPRMIHALMNIFITDLGRGTVVDPFSGSGTALLEASLLNLPSLGVDPDPISALISDCKVEPFTRGRDRTRALLVSVSDELNDGLPLFASRRTNENSISLLPGELRTKLERRDRLEGTRFLPEIERDVAMLRALRGRCARQNPGLLEVLLSDAVTKKIRYRFVGVGNGKYTIEVVSQSIVERLRHKVGSALALCDIFEWLDSQVGVEFGASTAVKGDARLLDCVPSEVCVGACITSPPYLPASSGREHYASSRTLALNVTGLSHALDTNALIGGTEHHEAKRFDPCDLTSSGKELVRYLMSDADRTDPQRDAMRFERKAIPTARYLVDIETFLHSLRKRIREGGVCLLIVASQHVFYSHRRLQEMKANGDRTSPAVEYVSSGRALYGEIAERSGWRVGEEIKMQLAKSVTSMARPRAQDDYSESVLVLRPA